MKKYIFILFIAICGLLSCSRSKRIVTDIPIKTDILGIELCKKMTFGEVQDVLMRKTDKYFYAQTQKVDNKEHCRFYPMDLNLIYGGLSWTYIDVLATNDSEVYYLNLVGSYESVERAKQQYDLAVAIFTKKYGKGNISENNTFWTDNVNSVGLTYKESSSLNGSDRSFCSLYYINIELDDKVNVDAQLDI